MKLLPPLSSLVLSLAAVLATFASASPHLPPGTNALSSATPHGRGPLALVNLNHVVLGLSRIFGSQQRDRYLMGGPVRVEVKQITSTQNEVLFSA